MEGQEEDDMDDEDFRKPCYPESASIVEQTASILQTTSTSLDFAISAPTALPPLRNNFWIGWILERLSGICFARRERVERVLGLV